MAIGSTLASARESAGLTVEDVAARTRIRRTLVIGMEADDFSACGGDFYARAHLRTVAATLGLEGVQVEALLAEFDAAHPGVVSPRATHVFEAETRARPERRGPNWSAAMAAALVLVVGYGVWAAFTGPEPVPDRIAGTRPAATGSASPPGPAEGTSSPTPSADGSSAVARVPREKVTVALVATDTTWVQVTTATGQELFQGLLDDGARKSFTDKNRLRLIIGNAGGIDLTVNGTEIGAPGRPGQVARVQFTPTDPAAG